MAAGPFHVKRGKLDRYGRRLARITVDGLDLSAALIAAGLGRADDGGKRAGWCG